MRRKGNRHQPGSAHGSRGSQGPLSIATPRLETDEQVVRPVLIHVLKEHITPSYGAHIVDMNKKGRGGKVDRKSSYFFLGDWPYMKSNDQKFRVEHTVLAQSTPLN